MQCSVFQSTKPDNMRQPDVGYFFTLRQEIRFDLGDSLRKALIQVWWWNSSVRFLSETSPCVVGVCSCRLWCYLCWCFLLFIFWTGGERVFTLVAIKRTVSHKIMMMMITTNYSHWLQQGLTPSDRLPHGFFRQTSIGAASEARCLSLSDWIVIWCTSNCTMHNCIMRDMLIF